MPEETAVPDRNDDINRAKPGAGQAEQSSDDIVTPVRKYAFVPAEKHPPVKGTAAYKPLEDNTVRSALNAWAGRTPIFHANDHRN